MKLNKLFTAILLLIIALPVFSVSLAETKNHPPGKQMISAEQSIVIQTGTIIEMENPGKSRNRNWHYKI